VVLYRSFDGSEAGIHRVSVDLHTPET